MARRGAVTVLLMLFAVNAFAARLSPKFEEWREGPAQWIMTPDEQKAWKALAGDEEAGRFVDLFWARRDPTPGTTINEYRVDFEARVAIANEQFGEPRKKGAMSDRGRVFLVLGQPTEGGTVLGGSTMHVIGRSTAGNPGDGNRMRGAKDSWLWTNADAAKFDMPKVEVVFIEDPVSGKVQRDPLRADFPSAATVAIRKSIVSPDLTAVPEWAAKNTIEPLPSAPAALTATGNANAASRLTFVRDIYTVNASSKSDPFAKVTPVAAFAAPGELPWIAQYCSGADKPAPLRFSIRITGPAGKRKPQERITPAEEITPDALKSAPGCYLLRGLVGLDALAKGDYQVQLTVQDPATRASSVVTEGFRVE